jgi:hypothetical protein
MPRHDKAKINQANGTRGKKNRSCTIVLLYWLHSFPLSYLMFSTLDKGPMSNFLRINLDSCESN